jgi:aspartyl-tRNA(Asn)/glutamyl-tRNA(Gln) amidotransferase subunit B
MNSIRNVQRAIEFEIVRQITALENGETLFQETRSYDALKNTTMSMRSKEAANDYRYFPEPDLQPLIVDEVQINTIRREMPALPRDLHIKYTSKLGLSEYDAGILTDQKGTALFYEEVIALTSNYKAAANWIIGDVKSYLNEFGVDIEDFPLPALRIAELIALIDEGKVSTSIASQNIFPVMLKNTDKTPLLIAEELNLIQDSNEDAILGFIHEVIRLHPTETERYRAGEKQLIGFFMGQLMKVSKGKADPKAANALMRQTLEN